MLPQRLGSGRHILLRHQYDEFRGRWEERTKKDYRREGVAQEELEDPSDDEEHAPEVVVCSSANKILAFIP